MEQLDALEQEMSETFSELDEQRDARELLKEQAENVEKKLREIIDNLGELEGEAQESVKNELTEEHEKKMSEAENLERDIESKEQELEEKMSELDEAIGERNEARDQVQDLASEADIDVGDAVKDINSEISRLEENKNTILEMLNNDKRSSYTVHL